jgi:hypothetical protein
VSPSFNLQSSFTLRPSQLHVNAVLPFVLLFATFKSTLGFEGCNICADGSTITKPDHFIDLLSSTCQDYSDYVLTIDSESLKCEKLRFVAPTCGCPVLLDPCTLCSDGSSISNPDNVVIPCGDGQYTYMCQDYNDLLKGIPNDSESCRGSRSAFGVSCGCPAFGNLCTMCKGGALMDTHDKEFIVTVRLEAIHALFLDDAGDVSTEMFTCGSAETALSALYQQDDSKCYWNQLLHGQACGCPDNSEIITLGWTQRCTGTLSLSGSLLIIVSISTKSRKVRWSPYNQIILGISYSTR